jgi:hypothetical protein
MTTIMQGDAETRISLSGVTILIHESAEGETGYWGEVIELPGCVSQGETLAEMQANIQEAIGAICSMTRIPDDTSYNFTPWPLTETGTA